MTQTRKLIKPIRHIKQSSKYNPKKKRRKNKNQHLLTKQPDNKQYSKYIPWKSKNQFHYKTKNSKDY